MSIMAKLKLFYKSFYNFCSCIYIKMSKSLSAKRYQENKERLQIKARERYQNLSKEEKEIIDNMVVNVKKISLETKNKNLLSTEKNIIE